ncbi:hypothetical protein [Corynebacterium gerontici]|uniref:Uncharacterized protein n=1 Tax=Corynebacterium gerontici TaxID=2079234 RepID=A0A3G6J151_9CORY|nr:hypothetical protein [Corynebacterium gerontici]AZA11646.1 hypothetical protein CGERO_06730 [Corynebacterium gerontici]
MKHRLSAALCAGTLAAALLPATAHAAPNDPTVEATPTSESQLAPTSTTESEPEQSEDSGNTDAVESATADPTATAKPAAEAQDAEPDEPTTSATPSSSEDDAPQESAVSSAAPAIDYPSFYYVDAKTGKALPGGTASVTVTDTSTGASEEMNQLVIEDHGAQLARELIFNYPDGKSNGEPVDVFDIKVVNAPAGYKAPENSSGSIKATDNGWDATGAIKEIAPNQFVIEMEQDSPADRVAGTEDKPPQATDGSLPFLSMWIEPPVKSSAVPSGAARAVLPQKEAEKSSARV